MPTEFYSKFLAINVPIGTWRELGQIDLFGWKNYPPWRAKQFWLDSEGKYVCKVSNDSPDSPEASMKPLRNMDNGKFMVSPLS